METVTYILFEDQTYIFSRWKALTVHCLISSLWQTFTHIFQFYKFRAFLIDNNCSVYTVAIRFHCTITYSEKPIVMYVCRCRVIKSSFHLAATVVYFPYLIIFMDPWKNCQCWILWNLLAIICLAVFAHCLPNKLGPGLDSGVTV